MIAYHASTVTITDFYMPYGGLHLGGIRSALECGLRKVYKAREEGFNLDGIVLHICKIKSQTFTDCEDMGSCDGWRSLCESEEYDKVFRYVNKWEPDTHPSFCTFNKDLVEILDFRFISIDDAEDMLAQ